MDRTTYLLYALIVSKAFLILILSVVSGVIAQVVLKKGSVDLPALSPANLWSVVRSVLLNYYLLLWVAFGAVSAFLWMLAMSKLDLSMAFPFAQALSIVLIVVFSYLYFAESISYSRWAGIGIIVVGLFLVTR